MDVELSPTVCDCIFFSDFWFVMDVASSVPSDTMAAVMESKPGLMTAHMAQAMRAENRTRLTTVRMTEPLL